MGICDWIIGSSKSFWSAEQKKLMGLEASSGTVGIGKAFSFIHPDDRPGYVEQFSKAKEKGEAFQAHFRVIRADGNVRWVEKFANFFKDEDGRPKRIVSTSRDITGRKELEENLCRSNAELEAIINSISDAVIFTDPERRVVSLNPAATTLFGYTQEELKGKTTESLYPDKAAYVAIGRQRYRQDIPLEKQIFELQYKRKDGTLFYAESLGTPVWDCSGIHLGFVGIHRDISERKRVKKALRESAEQLRKAKEDAEKANHAKSEFLTNMSHEIRTPMTVIMGALDQITACSSVSEQRQLVEMAQVSGKRLLSLINDLLDISRIEACKVDLTCEPFDPRAFIEKTARPFEFKANDKKLNLHWSIDPLVPKWIAGDRHRLEQVLSNLLANAVKFTEQGEIEIRVGICPEENNFLLFSVRDTGIGIPPAIHDQIFGYFTQMDASISRKYGGTGLGLAISKKLVELMDGSIWFESEEGQGSVFFFTLPLNAASEKGTPPKELLESPATEPSGKQANILVAEDEPLVRKLLQMILKKPEWQVTTAKTGKEAVALWEARPFDLILMDVQMPEMDGLEATRIIRDGEAGKKGRIPIIGLTAHARKEDKERCLAAGMSDYLTKPLDMKRLLTLVKKTIEG